VYLKKGAIGAWEQNKTRRATGSREKFDDIFSRLDTIHEPDGQTDTGRQQRPRLRVASRDNKMSQ